MTAKIDFMDMSLVVKLDGGVQETNIVKFETEANKIIESINMDLQTDDDFAQAEATTKDCKVIETRIDQAKQDALHSIDDISALFQIMDRLHDKFRQTRLDLEKKVKSEKANRKGLIVKGGIDKITEALKGSPVSHHEAFTLSKYRADIESSVKGKKNLSAMVEAIDEVVDWYYDQINEATELFEVNSQQIRTSMVDFPGLFPDIKQLCLKSKDEVSALIESRINQHKLELIEREQARKDREEKDRLAREIESTKEPEPSRPTFTDFPVADDFPKPAYENQILTVTVNGPDNDIYALRNILENNPLVVSVHQ